MVLTFPWQRKVDKATSGVGSGKPELMFLSLLGTIDLFFLHAYIVITRCMTRQLSVYFAMVSCGTRFPVIVKSVKYYRWFAHTE
jgi:hypothetical protein